MHFNTQALPLRLCSLLTATRVYAIIHQNSHSNPSPDLSPPAVCDLQEAELKELIGRVAGAKADVEVVEAIEAEDLSGLEASDLEEEAVKEKVVRQLDDIFELYTTEEGR